MKSRMQPALPRRKVSIGRQRLRLAAAGCLVLAGIATAPAPAAAAETTLAAVRDLVKTHCLDCHSGTSAEAGVPLDRLLAVPDFEDQFKTWQKVAAVLASRKMPPPEAPQPAEEPRQAAARAVRAALAELARARADDPGPVVIRRLSSAEYGYTLEDLTGLKLNLAEDFVSDAVGGEGFTNAGSAQFIQDSTLERYLEAARRVADHVVIGSGPLQFFADPGQTGLELSAIHRIQALYRRYGFRSAAGEGAEPFGLEIFPRAFYVAWRYEHRARLGRGDATIADLAREEGLAPAFAEHIAGVVKAAAPSFPASEVIAAWRALPAPGEAGGSEPEIRAACAQVFERMRDWQSRLARSVRNDEEAAVLSEESLQVARSHAFTARFVIEEGNRRARIEFSVVSATPGDRIRPVVLWRDVRVRLRRLVRRREEPQALASFLSAEEAAKLRLGTHPQGGSAGPNDFVIAGTETRAIELALPEGVRGLDLSADVELDLAHGENCVVRCGIAAAQAGVPKRAVSTLLADPQGEAFQRWKAGVLEFARLLPAVSHREPAPSDRDPIPEPFDNTYNARERDYFHYRVKYYRDDEFLVTKLLDEPARRALDEAWADLLCSFEYHDAWLRFVADKFKLALAGRGIATLTRDEIERLPDESRTHVARLKAEYEALQARFAAGQTRHVDDCLELAARAWRRPLAPAESERLRAYYRALRGPAGLDHSAAIRALVARVLVAPDFLYRVERPAAGAGPVPLSDWELASRLSYFLWASLPDDELRQAAAAGRLGEAEELSRQVRRMLADPKARRLATEFFGQWFGFYRFDRYRGVDRERFPEFTEKLQAAMYDEAVSFFEHIVRADRPVDEILFADYAFVDRQLAAHYGIPAATAGDQPVKTADAAQHQRGGLLSLGAVLTVTSAPLRTSPVKRGDWILRRVLGTPVPPPPADAGSIAADEAPADGLTVKARLEAHRRNATCANCHSRFDPLGFALEHYDSLGRWRERYRDGTPIDDSGRLADGTLVAGRAGLLAYLRQHQAEFHRTLCTKLVGYCLGRGEQLCDQVLIDGMVQGIAAGQDRFADLVEKVVLSRQFRYHRGAAAADAAKAPPARGVPNDEEP